MIYPFTGGPEYLLFWLTKEIGNAVQEACKPKGAIGKLREAEIVLTPEELTAEA